MQRPVMDPTYPFDSLQARRRRKRIALRPVLLGLLAVLRAVGRYLFANPLNLRRRTVIVREPRGLGWLLRGLAYRLLFLPLLLALAAAALVFSGTHPLSSASGLDPNSRGLYYDPINFVSTDGTRLEGWLIPVVDARRVIAEQDRLLHSRGPAVVLVHDFGQSPQQLLPLLVPLHDDGLVVLAVGLRGVGITRPDGQTFGLNEAQDVKAAVEMLRRRPFVDPDRVGVLGIGTGANAALLAAEHDPRLRVLILDGPVPGSADAVARYLGPTRLGLRWMQPVCKWAFDLAYHVDADDMNLDRFTDVLAARAVLRFPGEPDRPLELRTAMIKQVRAFCREKLRPSEMVVDAGWGD